MQDQPIKEATQPNPWAEDPKWQLVERICETADFRRAPRLAEILRFLCAAVLENRGSTLHEQDIGVALFGRMLEYDSSNDTIVRSNMLRLRRRLENYFQHEGAGEPLQIEIPIGSYLLRFFSRVAGTKSAPPEQVPGEPKAPVTAAAVADEGSVVRRSRRFDGQMAIGFLAGLCFAAILFLAWHHISPFGGELSSGSFGGRQTTIEQRFWNSLFSRGERTIVVPGDSVLILYETLTGHEVTLAEYTNGLYLSPGTFATSPSLNAMHFELHRYTSVVDLNLTVHLSHLPQWNSERSSIVFARDLRPAAAANSNLILIGSKESNPWVSLVEPSMNFILMPDGRGGFLFTNRHPINGEENRYIPHEAKDRIGASIVYGDVAYLPNPSGRGMTLVLSGLWMSGAQAAGDFVFDRTKFSAWLESIANPDGTIPSFEVLTATRSVENNAIDSFIVTKRIYRTMAR